MATLRRVEAFDIDRILEIENIAFADDSFSRKTFIAYLQKCPDLFWVAELNGAIVAYVITDVVEDKAVIASIAVGIGYRRKGIGSQLIKAALDDLISKEIGEVYLRVKESNDPAIRFWEKFGFKPDIVIPNFYYDSTQALQMVKALSIG